MLSPESFLKLRKNIKINNILGNNCTGSKNLTKVSKISEESDIDRI